MLMYLARPNLPQYLHVFIKAYSYGHPPYPLWLQGSFHHSLKVCWSLCQPHGHAHPVIDTAVSGKAGQVAALPLKGHIVEAHFEVQHDEIPGLPQLTAVFACVHQGVIVFISLLVQWYDILTHVVWLP